MRYFLPFLDERKRLLLLKSGCIITELCYCISFKVTNCTIRKTLVHLGCGKHEELIMKTKPKLDPTQAKSELRQSLKIVQKIV